MLLIASASSLIFTGLAVLLLAAILKVWNASRARRLPPGPNPIPIVGNVTTPKNVLGSFKAWADQYGDIMTLKVAGMPIIVINSQAAASEILEKRANSSYGRPRQVMAQELVGLGPDSSQTSDPKAHKEYRRLFASAISPRAVQAYEANQLQQFRQAALEILTSPESYMRLIHRAVSAIAYRVAYGYDITGEEDPMLVRANMAMRILEEILGPTYVPLDVIPWLKYLPEWMPGAAFRRNAKLYKAHYEETRDTPFALVQGDIAAGHAKPSFVASLLDDQSAGGKRFDKERIKWAAASIHSAGSDTTVAVIHNFIAAMVLYPQAQTRAQQELDTVIGREKMPTVSDRERLPYCWAVVQETMRWQPAAPFALLHRMTKNELYGGYVLSEGTTVMANVWAMSRDERDYPEASAFRPERYLPHSSSKSVNTDTVHATFGFGFGRRVCPGQHLAEATTFAAVVTLLWAFRLELKEGGTVEWGEHVGVHRPKEFPIDVKPRFPGVAELLQSSLIE